MKKVLRTFRTVGIGFALISFSFACQQAKESPEGLSQESSQESVRSKSAEGTTVYIIEPTDGAIVQDTVLVKFGIKGMDIAPAGTDAPNSGHHHLLVDTDSLPPFNQPMSDQVLHFGKGQTGTTLVLEPGTHTLQLILGDKSHIPHDPPVISEKITITVR